jgi:murein peptide amidase A
MRGCIASRTVSSQTGFYIMRSFAELSGRFAALASPDCQVDTFGQIDGYDLLRLRLAGEGPTVLLTGGIHGDEPAGPQALATFVAARAAQWKSRFSFLVLPCLNPWGYVHDKREDAQGEDLNRGFERDDLASVDCVRQALVGQRFVLHHDFHEDWEAAGFYFYEGEKEKHYISPQVIERVGRLGPIDAESEAEEEADDRICLGAYEVAASWGQQGFVPYTLHRHTDHGIISETPTTWPLGQRVTAHLEALETALQHHAAAV